MASPDAFSDLRLVCPRCRRLDQDGKLLVAELREASSHRRAVLGALGSARALECASPGCRARYPVVAGIPVIFRSPDACALDPAAWFGPSAPGTETLAAAVTGRDPASPLAQDVARVGRWAWAGFGDWVEPACASHARDVARWLLELGQPRDGMLAALGCALGREAWEWPGPTLLVDAHLPSLLAARALLAEGRLDALLPEGGHDWRPLRLVAPRAPPERAGLLCADVLDPPFDAGALPQVLAPNLLDSVSNPWLLLQQLAASTADGGWLAVTSPFAWRAEVTPRERWLSSLLPMTDRQALPSLAAGLGLRLVDERELSWSLWGSERESVAYRSACFAFRKEGREPPAS
jgi:hypothetical protein